VSVPAASSNVLVSGSDDNYLKVWDRRSLGEGGSFTKPSGVLVGHTEGVTFVAPKGDGRFVISNGKDQVSSSSYRIVRTSLRGYAAIRHANFGTCG